MSEKEDSLSFKLGPAKSLFSRGRRLTFEVNQWAKGSGIKCAVITSPRHGEEIFEGKQFKELLHTESFPFLITDRISTKEVEKFIHQFDEPAFFLLEPLGFLKDILSKFFNHKLINAHGTRLPENRGGGGFSWPCREINKGIASFIW